METLERVLFATILSGIVMGLILGGLVLGPSIIEWFISLPDLGKIAIVAFIISFIVFNLVYDKDCIEW